MDTQFNALVSIKGCMDTQLTEHCSYKGKYENRSDSIVPIRGCTET